MERREPGLRERKKAQTRRRIERVALDLFERDGFDATTIGAIAEAVDVAPRTFFHYFETKEDVVLADYAGRLDRILAALGDRPADEPAWSALRAAFRSVAEDYETERDGLVRRFRIMITSPSVFGRSLALQAGWEDALATVLVERAVTGASVSSPLADVDAELVSRLQAAAALAAMRASLRHWLVTGAERALPRLVDDCFASLGDGLDGP